MNVADAERDAPANAVRSTVGKVRDVVLPVPNRYGSHRINVSIHVDQIDLAVVHVGVVA